MGELERLYAKHRDDVAFFVVYIREAHPEDGWILADNRNQDIALHDPTTSDEREQVAETCAARLDVTLPVLVDGLDDEVARRYGGWPDRLYLVGRDGNIAFQGGEGPFGFKPEELASAIKVELSRN